MGRAATRGRGGKPLYQETIVERDNSLGRRRAIGEREGEQQRSKEAQHLRSYQVSHEFLLF